MHLPNTTAQLEEGDPAPRASAWDVRVLDDLDETWLERTVAFLQRFTPPGTDPVWSVDYFKWKLGSANPAGRGFLTCAISGEDVVGVTSITPKRAWYRQQVMRAAEIGDAYTHPAWLRRPTTHRTVAAGSEPRPRPLSTSDYLTRSIFGRLSVDTRARALQQGIQLIYGTPNARSRAGYEKRLGFVSHVYNNQSMIRLTARGVVSRDHRLAWGLRLLSVAEDAYQGIAHAVSEVPRRTSGDTVELMAQATDELDELWDRLKGQYAFSLLRDRAYFQYRFFEHPLATYRIYRLSRRGRLDGVMVTRTLTTTWGKRYCHIADWCVDVSRSGLFPILLEHVMHAEDRTCIDGFFLWSGTAQRSALALRLLGFVGASAAPIIFFQHAAGRELLERCRDLDFTLACSDNV